MSEQDRRQGASAEEIAGGNEDKAYTLEEY